MMRIAIIGGGPAASAAAISLLRSAPPITVEVTIFESREFPRSKVCGEFVSPSASAVLEGLLGSHRLSEAGARHVNALTFHNGPTHVTWPMPTPAWTLSRMTLDKVLLDEAASLGARVYQPAHVREVRYTDTHVELATNDGTITRADLVIHADGSGRHDAGGTGETPARRGVIGLKCFIRPSIPPPIDGLHMRAAHGAYIGAVGVEDGLATVALVARTSLETASIRRADELVRSVWPEFDPSCRIGEWLACPVRSSRFIPPGHPRSFRIGNAAAAVEPVGGEGIGLALWSGSVLGTKLAAGLHERNLLSIPDLQQIQHQLARAYRRRLTTRLPACRAAATVLMRPALVSLVWPLLCTPGLILRPWYALTGKPLKTVAD